MIEGLGFRYYWATEGLRPEDLSFKPSEEARTSRETIEHIYGLTNVVSSSIKGEQNKPQDIKNASFEEIRMLTLQNLDAARTILAEGKKLEDCKIIFGSSREFDFWYNINGPISDAIWHVGQIITFRRTSGNPYNNKASVFSGKVRK